VTRCEKADSIPLYIEVVRPGGSRHEITVNTVAPGWTRPDMNAAVRENADMAKAIEADAVLGGDGGQ
jgi:NAD(P)-dependent dehydrogenase (short-subunit alcohol dehydrogenase family)